MKLSDAYHVELPISRAVYRILFEQLSPSDAMKELFLREQKAEF